METPKTIPTRASRQLAALKLISVAGACLILSFAAVASAPEPDPAAAPPNAVRRRETPARPMRLAYYVDDRRAFASLEAHAAEISLLAPQCFWVDAQGVVHGAIPEPVLQLARRRRLPLMPLVINHGFDRATATALLRNPQAQERAVMYLAYLAKRDNTAGFQINLENLDPADQENFTSFVRRAAARLHRDGRWLSVAVVPRFSDADAGRSPSGKFATGEWGAPYDYRALGRWADFVVLMAYDQHGRRTPPGPVASYNWVREALDYALSRVSPEKLLLGVPLYGREWIENGQAIRSRSLSFQDVQALVTRAETEAQWDVGARTPWLQYRNGDSRHTAWFEDQRSLQEKLRLVQSYRLRGFAAWRLGFEDTTFWKLVTSTFRSTKTIPSSRTGKPGTQKDSRKTRVPPK